MLQRNVARAIQPYGKLKRAQFVPFPSCIIFCPHIVDYFPLSKPELFLKRQPLTFPSSREFGGCSILISCIMENIEEAFKASLGVGTSIVSLLPTILALIGKLFSYHNYFHLMNSSSHERRRFVC